MNPKISKMTRSKIFCRYYLENFQKNKKKSAKYIFLKKNNGITQPKINSYSTMKFIVQKQQKEFP